MAVRYLSEMLFFVILCLFLILILAGTRVYRNVPTGNGAGAIIEARYGISSYTYAALNISIEGPGENITAPLKYAAPYANYTAGEMPVSTAIAIQAPTLPSIIPVQPPYREYYAIFPGLRRYTAYDLTLKGIEGPACMPGIPCMTVVRLVNESMRVTTGAYGTVAFANFS